MVERSHFPRKGILLRVTEADFERLQGLAEGHGKSLGAWCLDVLLSVARYPAGTAIEQALLSEIIAIRTIVANLIYAFTNEGTVTREQMLAFIERADKTKLYRATEFLSQLLDEELFSNHKRHPSTQKGD